MEQRTGTGSSVAVSPTSTTTYTATCSVNGCTSSNGSVTVAVNGGGGGGSTCIGLGNDCSANASEIKTYTINMPSGGTKALTLTYRSHEGNTMGCIRINNGAWQTFSLGQTPGDLSYLTTGIGNYALNRGNNTIQLASNGGYICFQTLCAGSGSARLGAAEEVSADQPEQGRVRGQFLFTGGRQGYT